MMTVSTNVSQLRVGKHLEERGGRLERLRRSAAHFWVGFLMLGVLERAPSFVRFTRPIVLWFTWHTARVIRRNLMFNARRLLGENSTPAARRSHGKRVLRNFFDFICEIRQAARIDEEQLLAQIAGVEGREHYDRARSLGRGAIVVTAHLGSFELGVASLRQFERRIHVVFQRDSMARFERMRTKQHRRLGVVEARVEEGIRIWMDLRDALARDEVVLIQGDRVMPGQRGERLPFFDGHMMFPAGPVKLSVATGAPIVPIFSLREPDGRVRIHIEKPIVPEQSGIHPALIELAAVIERYVKRYPDQWLRLDRAFCEDHE